MDAFHAPVLSEEIEDEISFIDVIIDEIYRGTWVA
jgi:hypothetical protein